MHSWMNEDQKGKTVTTTIQFPPGYAKFNVLAKNFDHSLNSFIDRKLRTLLLCYLGVCTSSRTIY